MTLADAKLAKALPYSGATREVLTYLARTADADGFTPWDLSREHIGASASREGRLGESTVKRALYRLLREGRLTVVTPGHKPYPTIYRVHLGVQIGVRDEPPSSNDEPPNEPPNEPPTPIFTVLRDSTPLQKHSRDELFEMFYAAYPRNYAKGRADMAWNRAVMRAGGAEIIIAAAQHYAADPNLPKEKRWIPYAATWLDDQGWLDPALPESEDAEGGRWKGSDGRWHRHDEYGNVVPA